MYSINTKEEHKKAFISQKSLHSCVCVIIIFRFLFVSSYTFAQETPVAQEISVSNFYLAESDLTANNRQTTVYDQNGDKCALIRVQTSQKDFHFDVGTLGVTKVEDNHVGEIWVYVPNGVRRLDIRHPILGSLVGYEFPISIIKSRTYILELTSGKVFTNIYDDSKKQKLLISVTPVNSEFFLNGMKVNLNNEGRATQELSFGTYTYKVISEGFYPKEGQITINDEQDRQTLNINDLKPIMGKLSVHTNPYSATVLVDEKKITNSSLNPISLQVGKHEVEVSNKGYKTETRIIEIEKDQTLDIQISLTREAVFEFNSSPIGSYIYIENENIGVTPCSKLLTTGTYKITATKKGYKDFSETMNFDSSNPNINVTLNKIFNYKNEFYIEGNIKYSGFMAFGGTIGGYIQNVNVEASFFHGLGESEPVYWSGNEVLPIEKVYSPQMNISGKLGFGIPLGTRFRITPQLGVSFLKLKESTNAEEYSLCEGANAMSVVLSSRVSVAIMNNLAISISPEYLLPMSKSSGFESLSSVSTKIDSWAKGFNVKVGLAVFF